MTGKNMSVLNIQVLRGVAALLVVVYHGLPITNAILHTMPKLHFGAFGVDIFFVISGFVMYYSNQAMDRSRRAFLVARIIRIVPLYWLATLLLIGLFLIGFRPAGLHILNPRIALESLAFIPSLFPHDRHDLILSIGWTLMYELFFYVWFALALRLATAWQSFIAVSAAFIILVILGRTAAPLPFLANFYTSPIILEFLYGGLLAFLYIKWPEQAGLGRIAVAWAMIALGLGLIAAQDALHIPLAPKDGLRFILFGVPAALVVGGTLALERAGQVIRTGFWQLLGAASYALYLFHPIAEQFAIKLASRLIPVTAPFAPVFLLLAGATCAIATAIAVHLLIERRILQAGRQLMTSLGLDGRRKA